MRINDTFNVLNRTLSTAIRRQYPLVYTDRLTNSFDNLTLPENLENSLAKIPYIEALPQYKTTQGVIMVQDLKHCLIQRPLENRIEI